MTQDAILAASHDLLSPLNLIRGYAVTLSQLNKNLTESQRQRYLRAIETAAVRTTRSIRSLLDLPKMETERLHLADEPTSLVKLVRQVVSELQSQSIHNVIKLSAPRSSPLVRIDRQKIKQVMINLLDNAIKYSPQGSDIVVSVRESVDEDGALTISNTRNLIVDVKDPGAGIPEADLDLVFEKFYRVNNRLTRSTPGVGIGLYICKLIVEAQGGRIWATSKVGEGSTFSFSLPVD
jgi:K+-sensing histidine kinase KdpD